LGVKAGDGKKRDKTRASEAWALEVLKYRDEDGEASGNKVRTEKVMRG
jgi:hypothetical protein